MLYEGAHATISRTVLRRHEAWQSGGALGTASDCSLEVVDSTFESNFAVREMTPTPEG